jgi:hypothetical protein
MKPPLFLLGCACGAAILAYQVAHAYLWFGGQGLGGGPFLKQLFQSPSGDLTRYYAVTQLVIYSLIGFASIAWFLPERRKPASTGAQPKPAGAGPSLASIAPALPLLLPLLLAHPTWADDSERRYVVVGVRADAPPFSSVVGIGDKDVYTGYLIDLCQQIFAPHPDGHERYRMVTSEVTVYDRFERLRRDTRDPWQPGMPLADAKIDLLCDPVTLRYSMEASEPRLARRTDGIFSPMVYVTGVTYLERSRGGTGPAVLGFVGNTTAGKVALQACERDAFRRRDTGARIDTQSVAACRDDLDSAEQRYRREIDTMRRMGAEGRPWAVPRDLNCTEGTTYKYCIFLDYDSLADWFCAAREDEAKFYFGDRDLIVAQVEMRQKSGVCDGVNSDAPFYSYEPYALVSSPVDPDLARFVQRRIYEIFSDRATALALFAGNFEGKAMSVPLASLFLLNGTEDEMTTRAPDRCRNCSPPPVSHPPEAPIRQSAR